MPWARIPPDRLFVLPLFGIDLVLEEPEFLWYDMPGKGKMRVRKSSPRIWFEEIGDAHQAGAAGILLTETEQAKQDEAEALKHRQPPEGEPED